MKAYILYLGWGCNVIKELGYGKINLALAITSKRNDGYHDIDTVFHSIALHDVIQVEEADEWKLTCSEPALACDSSNLAYKAFAALQPYSHGRHAHVHIDKKIPIAAGLAGGSTDCAAVLRGLNRLWNLGLSYSQLCQIGVSLGADVPFCIRGGSQRGRGIGDQLEPLPSLPDWEVLIVHPQVPVYTKRAYGLFDQTETIQPVAVDNVARAVQQQQFDMLTACMGNTFEQLVIPDVPLIALCQKLLQKQGLRPLMAGSGPTVFALVPPQQKGRILYDAIRAAASNQPVDVYISRLVRSE